VLPATYTDDMHFLGVNYESTPFFTYILILTLSCHSHQADSTLQSIQFDLADPIQSLVYQELLDSTYYPGSVFDIPAFWISMV
jgi:hypothetical protein